ncbi:MAG: nickel pincer cofactor biosynthesis protein LarC, partial [Bacteroidota bacterium]
MSTIFIESFSGISGDMFLGALAGLSDSYDELRNLPEFLNMSDAQVVLSEVEKNGIACKHVKITDLNPKNTHHRYLSDIIRIIENAKISENAKKIAKEIFLIIGKSESKIHNIPLEKIHFHEISGVDSIIDIVGCAVLIDKLNIRKTFATAVCTGFGFVNTQHGKLPVPAPATADILSGIPHYAGDETGERVTPTGAAILKYLNPDFNVPSLKTSKIAYGPGEKDFISPNVLRLSLCKEHKKSDELYILETNIDDMSSEFLGIDFQEGLFKNGATDFYFTPVHMKKGRSGLLLSCTVEENKIQLLSDFVLENTSTIGVRYYPVERNTLKREIREYKTEYGYV